MSYVKAQLSVPQIEDVNGNPAAGYTISSYLWDTSTPTPMYTSSAGAGSATSFTLNSLGQPQSAGGTAVDIFLDSTITYKFIVRDSGGVQVGPTIGPISSSVVVFDTVADAIASPLSIGRALRAFGYTTAGDMPAADYIVVAGGTGTADEVFYHDMDNGHQLQLLHNGCIDVRWGGPISGEFGALASKVLQAIKNNSGISAAEVLLPYTAVTATTPINATNLNAKSVTIRGASTKHINNSLIRVQHTGVGLDCTGSRSIKFSNFSIQCSDTVVGTPTANTIPSVGILLARTDPGTSIDAGYHVFDNVYIDGHCSVASVYSYASEVNDYRSLFATNRHSTGKPALHVTQDNDASIASSFVTIATGTQSNSTLNFNGGQLWSTGGGGAGKAVILRGASNCRFRDTFVNTPDGLASFYIDGNIECSDITIDGVREENAGASAGPLYSIYHRGTLSNLSAENFSSAAKETSGYFLFAEAASTTYNPRIANIKNSYANNGIIMRTVQFPDIYYVGSVSVDTACSRGKIHATPILITTAYRTELFDLAGGQTCNLYKTLTASIADTATVDVTATDNYPSGCVFSYIIQSNQNSAHMSAGFFRTNSAGGTSNTLTLFGQSETNVAVTSPAANTLRITNNTGGAAAFYVRISVLAG